MLTPRPIFNAMTTLATSVGVAGSLHALPPEAQPAAPSPEKLLREMSEALKKAGTFRFHAEIHFDEVLASRQKLQYAGAVDVVVLRAVF